MLAARVRLNRVSKSLDQLLGVLRRRLDDPWFLHSMKRLKKEAMANSGGDAFSFADAVKRAARQDAIAETNAAAIDGKGSSGATKKRVVAKNGVFAQFRTARFLNRQRMARVEALERWSLIRESIPEVRAMGSAWWDRELPKVPGHTFFGFHFKEDSAKAAQVALAGGKTLRRLAFRVVHVVLDAAAERPVRALALIAGTALAGIAKDREKRGLAFLKLPQKLRKRSTHPTLPGGEPAVWEEQQQRTWKQTPFQVWMAAKTKGFTEFQTQPPAPAPPVRRKIPSKELVTPKPPPREEGDASRAAPADASTAALTVSTAVGAADAAASDAGAVCGAGVSQEGASICGAIVSQEDTRTAAAREGNAAVCCVDAEASREGAYAAAAREGSAAVCLCVDAEIDTSAGAEVGSEVGCSGRSGRRPGSCCSSGCSSCCSSGCSRCFSRGCSEVGSVARRAKNVRSRRSRSRSSRR